jgi:PAS domain S-box-containing protein
MASEPYVSPGRQRKFDRFTNWKGYLLALLLSALSLPVYNLAFHPGAAPMIQVFLLPVVVSAYYGGLGPGLLSTAIVSWMTNYYLLPPRQEFDLVLDNPIDEVRWLTLTSLGIIISGLNASLHQARRRAVREMQLNAVTLTSIGDAVIATDDTGMVSFMNPEAARLTGWSPSEARGKPLDQVFHIVNEETRQRVDDPVKKVLKSGGVVGLANHTVLIARDGREMIIDDSGAPIKQPDGKIIGVVLVFRDNTEKRQAEDNLRRHEEWLEETGRIARIGGWEYHPATGFLHWTNEVARIHELEQPLPVSKETAYGFYYGESQTKIREAAQVALTQGIPYDLELEIVTAKGNHKWIRTIGQPVWNGDKVVMLRGASQDITGHKLAEDERSRLASIVEFSDDAIMAESLGCAITSWNRGAEQIFGYSAAEAIGQPMSMLFASERQHEGRMILDTICRGESLKRFETICRCQNGHLLNVSLTVSPIRDSSGKIVGASKIARNITPEKQAQQELIWKSAFLEAQVDSALDAILVVDGNVRRILQNQRLLQLFKVPKSIAEDSDDSKLLEHVRSKIKRSKQFIERVEYLYAHPEETGRDEIELVDGTILDRYSAPVLGRDGKYYGRIWTFRDITDRRRLEEQFRQSQKMDAIGQLAGGVAHDINNILGVINLQSELLRVTDSLTAEQLECVTEINATVQRASALTRQLLLFSRREMFQPRNVDLSESITGIAKMLRRILGETIQVQLKLAPAPMLIHGDAGMMDQVLLNLAVNSRDAMPQGGQLVIETTAVEFDEFAAASNTPSQQMRPGSYVCLSVSDNGCGIARENLAKIFEPFFTTKDVGKGTGLGLATVFGIVQQHQGWINVYSEVNHGTTFRIYLPRLIRASEPKTAAARPAVQNRGTGTILLVEDDASLRISVRKALLKFGYQIIEAASGVKALDVWRQNQESIQLLLTDLVMPEGLNGKDLAARLLLDKPALKVIYMSGYSAEIVSPEAGFHEGVNFLTKPFQVTRLAEMIQEMLGQPA